MHKQHTHTCQKNGWHKALAMETHIGNDQSLQSQQRWMRDARVFRSIGDDNTSWIPVSNRHDKRWNDARVPHTRTHTWKNDWLRVTGWSARLVGSFTRYYSFNCDCAIELSYGCRTGNGNVKRESKRLNERNRYTAKARNVKQCLRRHVACATTLFLWTKTNIKETQHAEY